MLSDQVPIDCRGVTCNFDHRSCVQIAELASENQARSDFTKFGGEVRVTPARVCRQRITDIDDGEVGGAPKLDVVGYRMEGLTGARSG